MTHISYFIITRFVFMAFFNWMLLNSEWLQIGKKWLLKVMLVVSTWELTDWEQSISFKTFSGQRRKLCLIRGRAKAVIRTSLSLISNDRKSKQLKIIHFWLEFTVGGSFSSRSTTILLSITFYATSSQRYTVRPYNIDYITHTFSSIVNQTNKLICLEIINSNMLIAIDTTHIHCPPSFIQFNHSYK